MKHNQRSASPCDLERQRFRDRLHRQAKQRSNSNHGRTVPIPVPPSSLLRRSGGTFLARKVARKLARRNFHKSLQNTQTGTQNTLFFSEDPNVDFRSSLIASPVARAARTEDQNEGVRSFDPRQTLDFPTQNEFPKLNLAPIFSLQPSELPASAKPRQVAQAWASPARTLPVKGQPGSGLPAFPLLGGEETGEGMRSFDTRQILDFPTQNAFPKLNLAAIFSLQPSVIRVPPSTLNPEIPQPIRACSAYLPQSDPRVRLISSPVARAARTEDQDEGVRERGRANGRWIRNGSELWVPPRAGTWHPRYSRILTRGTSVQPIR
jgi:hypothetical protein